MDQPYAYKPSWIKISLLALGLAAIIVGGYFLARKIWPPAPTQIYEALVAITDQKTSDPAEDLRSSLKTGDAMVILPEGHQWSETERISYLLIKMKLTEDQAQKLTQPEQKEIKQEARNTEQEKQSKDSGPRMETIRARAYRLKIETLGFNKEEFWGDQKQPYSDKVFGWELVEKKKSVN